MVEGGGSVTICRRGVPVVDIVRTKRPARKPRRLGTLKGKIQIADPDWWKPMTPEDWRLSSKGVTTLGKLPETAQGELRETSESTPPIRTLFPGYL